MNSKGLRKLTPKEVEEQVKAVEANTNMPADVKANVIQGIRDQGAP